MHSERASLTPDVKGMTVIAATAGYTLHVIFVYPDELDDGFDRATILESYPIIGWRIDDEDAGAAPEPIVPRVTDEWLDIDPERICRVVEWPDGRLCHSAWYSEAGFFRTLQGARQGAVDAYRRGILEAARAKE
jgi:hypothetical protein